MAYFVDTGILLRAQDRTDSNYPTIREALRLIWGRGDSLATATQNLREFWNVSTRPTSARGGYGRTVLQTARRVHLLERVLQIVPESPASFARWRELVELHSVVGVQVHDANLVAIMEIHGTSQLITLNPNDFRRYPGCIRITPAEIIATI